MGGSLDLDARRDEYREALLEDVLPFWTRHAIDREHGGYLIGLDRDGSVYDTDKPVWFLGRFAWMLAQAALSFPDDPRAPEWIQLARHGVEFSEQHGFAPDGQMYFLLDRAGRPLRKRRYIFSECFASMAYAALARAEKDVLGVDNGGQLFGRALHVYNDLRQRANSGLLSPKIEAATRPLRGLGLPTITLNVIQCLRDTVPAEHIRAAGLDLDAEADQCTRDMAIHLKPERQTVFETLAEDGSIVDSVEGRTLNPGHALEAAWFVMAEAQSRGLETSRGRELLSMGRNMLDWTWPGGWDSEHGGVLYFRDSEGRPVQDYWHDMKFWWPQNEAEIATLLAWKLTGDGRYGDWYGEVHDYSWELFPDPEHGEWFGYFARDGRRTSEAKGNHFKGPFHIPRMMWMCHRILAGD